ncbi:hypothetical protein GGX14DRAFT_446564, partial [Mycena pura]
MDPNTQKLKRYLANPAYWDSLKRSTDVAQWTGTDDPVSYRDALLMCQCIPPVTRTGESASTVTKTISEKERSTSPLKGVLHDPDWLEKGIHSLASSFDKPYPKEDRETLAPFLLVNRYKPVPPEKDERRTDKFHLNRILEPAAVIAASMLGQDVEAEYAPSQNDTVGDLIVTIAQRYGFIAESKRGLVFMTHLPALLALAGSRFPWPRRTEQPSEAVRMWIQIWAEMIEYDVFYAKRFSPLGTIYIYRKPGQYFLYHSQVYDDMDGDVMRSTALTLLAQSRPVAPLAARLMDAVVGRLIVQSFLSWFMDMVVCVALIVATVYGSRGVGVRTSRGYALFYSVGKETIFPAIFSTRLGAGSSGTVLRSADGRRVLKVFTDVDKARNEAAMLKLCHEYPEIRTPQFLGLYSNPRNFGIVMSYAGTAVKDIYSAPDDQKRQLVSILKALHRKGIHHHDVRSENIMINSRRLVTLVDFDRACLVDGGCIFCSDMEMIGLLEASMGY